MPCCHHAVVVVVAVVIFVAVLDGCSLWWERSGTELSLTKGRQQGGAGGKDASTQHGITKHARAMHASDTT